MHIHTVIDDQLLQHAAQITGLSDQRTLLEEALRLLIKIRSTNATAVEPDMITQLMNKPLLAADPTPFTREEMYAGRK
jgi:hypothetical protein